MKMITLQEVERRVAELAARIDASGHVLPTFGRSEDGARPHIEVDERGIHYVVVERGAELKRVTSSNLDEILYQVFRAVTFSLACDYELAHRDSGVDSRRLIFSHQVTLLNSLSPEWARRQAEHHGQILRRYPFDDRAGANS